MYFKSIAHRIHDRRKCKNIETVDRQEYASICTIRLNSQVHQYDGFTHGHRVFWAGAEITDRVADNPNIRDFTNTNEFPVKHTTFLRNREKFKTPP